MRVFFGGLGVVKFSGFRVFGGLGFLGGFGCFLVVFGGVLGFCVFGFGV